MSQKRRRRPKSGAAPASPRAEPEFNLAESPLAWLARRKDKDGEPLISDAEFRAGERLRADFWFAQMTPQVTANWSLLLVAGAHREGGLANGAESSDHAAAAAQRVRRALAAVAAPDLSGILIDVCCLLKGIETAEREGALPKRSGRILLRAALGVLARHYGLEIGVEKTAPSRIRHWGGDAYRPNIDGSQTS